MTVKDIPAELLIGVIVTMVSTLGTVIGYLYRDLRALNAQMVAFFKAQADEAKAKADWYARRDAAAADARRPHESYENISFRER